MRRGTLPALSGPGPGQSSGAPSGPISGRVWVGRERPRVGGSRPGPGRAGPRNVGPWRALFWSATGGTCVHLSWRTVADPLKSKVVNYILLTCHSIIYIYMYIISFQPPPPPPPPSFVYAFIYVYIDERMLWGSW